MRTFGGFRSGDRFFYGEIRGDEVYVLKNPFWIDIEPTGEVARLTNVIVDLPVAPSKLIAVGLNYADHIAEMKRTTLGTPLIWFKSPGSLLPHNGTIEIAFPEHQTDFEAELAVVISKSAKNVLAERALDFVFGYTIGLDISDRDLQKSEKQFGRCKSFDTYTPIGPFVYADVDVSDCSLELTEWEAAPKHAHEPDDLLDWANCFLHESIAHTFARRCDFNWNTLRRRTNSRRRSVGSSD
jgi:hypothetical protein